MSHPFAVTTVYHVVLHLSTLIFKYFKKDFKATKKPPPGVQLLVDMEIRLEIGDNGLPIEKTVKHTIYKVKKYIPPDKNQLRF